VKGLCEFLETMADRVRRVMRQTKVRIFGGVTKSPDKIVSLFEPHTEVIRKGKAGKPNEFGKLVHLRPSPRNEHIGVNTVTMCTSCRGAITRRPVRGGRRPLGRLLAHRARP